MHVRTTVCAFAAACCLAVSGVSGIAASTEEGAPKWGYIQESAELLPPNEWVTEFPFCGGERQSPIDIKSPSRCGTDVEREAILQFDGSCADFHLKQHDDVFKGEVLEGSCTVSAANSKPYSLLQFHMHAPSEHTVDGYAYDAEAHFVHQNDEGELLVVGLLIQKEKNADTNPWIKDVWHQLDNVHANKTTTLELSSYAELLAETAEVSSVFNYPGSLTTPPCDEIVDWWVLRQPVTVSEEDFDQFLGHTKRLAALDDGQGSRPTQPLNGREVVVY